MEGKPTVSLCMIVKNEERFLKSCLDSVKDLVNEMIIVDTGSTDKTIDIAKEFDAKIIYYNWKNDFADARNVSLSYAKMDWILLMDGDDIFDSKDYDKFKDILTNSDEEHDIYFFNTASFAGSVNGEIINNPNVRLVRNNKGYKFRGAIHEQITNENGIPESNKIKYYNINIYHYGYLTEVTKEKNKRNRNISILEEELKKDPENNFNINNLATEYYCLNNFEKSLELYNLAYKNMKPEIGYSSRLVMRRITNFMALGRFKEALQAIDEGLKFYPNYTDLVFEKAEIYEKQGKYTLAIRALIECLQRGESPMELNFLSGSGSYKAYELLGDIYTKLKDFDKALEAYEEGFKANLKTNVYIKKLMKTIILKKKDDNDFIIANYLEDKVEYNKNLILSNLLDYGFLEDFDALINDYNENITSEFLLLKARRLFYDKKYYEALGYFSYLEEKSYEPFQVAKYKTIIFLIISPDIPLNYVNKLEVEALEKELLTTFFNLNSKLEVQDFENIYDARKLLALSIDFLREILLLKEFDLFEKLVPILNYISDDVVLIFLAKLYDDLGFYNLAAKEVFRSIKSLNIVDKDCIDILKRGL